MQQLESKKSIHLLRKAWHVIGGLTICILYELYFENKWKGGSLLLSILVGFWAFEEARQRFPGVQKLAMSLLGPVLRKTEIERKTGTFYFLVGTTLTVFAFTKPIAILSILFLSFGDPTASYVGVSIGFDHFRLNSGKSLIASLAATIVNFLVSMIYVMVWMSSDSDHYPSIFDQWWFLVSASAIGGFVEILPTGIDDNLVIPLVSGLWMTLIEWMFVNNENK